MKILHIILYKAEFFSNFMESILYLAKELKKLNMETIVCVPERKWWKKFFDRENIKIELLPIKSVLDFKAIKIFHTIIKKYTPNIIHTHFGKEAQVIPCLYKMLFNSKIKIVWHWRNPPKTDIIINLATLIDSNIPTMKYLATKYKRIIGNLFYKLLDNFVSAHIVVSNELKEILIKRGFPKKKIKKIFNAIDIKKYNTDIITETNSTKVIGNISNFREQKDHITFIKAAKLVIDKYPNVKFILVGDGPTKSATIAYAKKIGILNNLVFTGIHQNVKEVIRQCNFVVLSSFYEGLPNVILESLVLEKPVIATNVGGVKDIIKDGHNGFLIPIRNYNLMAEKIIYLIENTEEIKRLGTNGRKTIEENFSINNWIKEIISVYEEILKK